MNEIIEAMRTRRSIRKFKPDELPRDVIEKIAEAGIWAASGRNRQSSVVVAVTDKEIIEKLRRTNAEIMGSANDPFYGAPAVLIVLAAKEYPTYLYDGSLVMGDLMLAAHSLGIGSCWIHRAKETFERPEWKRWLIEIGLDGDYEGIGHCALGYVDGEYPASLPRKEGRIIFS
jgi:nitroreductase